MLKRYEQLKALIALVKPETIIEVGTHSGQRAEMLCREALKYRETVNYIGFDLFENANEQTNAEEMNGKGAGSYNQAKATLESIKGVTFELIKGNTRETLHGTQRKADFAFIDGGHSVQTIKGDYEALRSCRLIAFDDYYKGAIDTDKFGCNAALANIQHEVLPVADRVRGKDIEIRIATIGYSSKWDKAIHRVVEKEGHKSVSVWHGFETQTADLICAVDGTLERAIDPDELLQDIRKSVKKRLFFAIQADALHSIEWWREKMAKYFQLLEWFCPRGDEVVGTAMPLFVVGEWESKGVLDDDKRFEQTAANVKVTSKRVKPSEPHDKTAAIICYGPSLTQTWPAINGETRFLAADIFSVSGAHDFLVRRGIVPHFHVECDPRPHKALNLNAPQKGTQYLLASCCHPDLIEKVKDYDLALWHLCNGHASYRILDEIESEKDQFLITGGGSAGLRAIALAYAMGYRNFSIYGMDCSFVPGVGDDIRQWAGAHKGKRQAVIDIRCGEKWFKTSPVLVTYARHFFDTVQRAHGAKFAMHGDGLLQEMCKHAKADKQEEKVA